MQEITVKMDRRPLVEHLDALAHAIAQSMGDATEATTSVPGLTLYRNTAPSAPNPCSYQPSLLIIAQGQKRIELGKESYSFGQLTYLLTSIELPIVSQVSVASKEVPYLAFFLRLDMEMVREIVHSHESPVSAATADVCGMVLGEITEGLLAPCLRLVHLLESPEDVSFMSRLLHREIIYRLLQSTQGHRLRSVATMGNQNYKTAKAINWLRENYEKPLNVDQLAKLAGMSRSTLHHHFRSLTAMSPLQFQKQLRLHGARQKMLIDRLDAASAAFEVGYESPSQFNREYKRFFGKPPVRDIQALQPVLRKSAPA